MMLLVGQGVVGDGRGREGRDECSEGRTGLLGTGVQYGSEAEVRGAEDVGLGVVDEDGPLGCDSEVLKGELEDRRVGLARADLAGDGDVVEEQVDPLARVGVAPAAGEQADLESALAKFGDEVEHRKGWTHPGEEPAQRPLRDRLASVDGGQLVGEERVEFRDRQFAGLQPVHRGAGRYVAAEPAMERAGERGGQCRRS